MNKPIIITLIALLILAPIAPAYGADFNPHLIVHDSEMEDFGSMSVQSIQRFLESKGSFLAKFTQVVNGARKTASQIIFDEAQTYQISPKFIMAMLQKEQSLLTDGAPSQDQLDWAVGFGVCDSCSKSDPNLAIFRGFYNQVSDFAEKVRVNYLRDLINLGHTYTGWGPGLTKTTLDGYEITPANNATAVLYTYNPYRGGDGRLGANFNFWRIWQRYFMVNYPDGTLLQQKGEATVWLIQDGKKRPFLTRGALYSRYDPKQIIQIEPGELDKYDIGTGIKFANYSLLRSPAGTVYLLRDDTLHGIQSQKVFRTLGFNPEEVVKISADEVKGFSEGAPITIASAYPKGGLLQNKQTGAVFYVENGQKQGIIDRAVLAINFKNKRLTKVANDELANYADSGPMKLKDGTLITSPDSRAVYVIAKGERRPFVSGEAFEKLGYHWSDIVSVPAKVVALHTLGEPVDTVVVDSGKEVLGDNAQ